MDIIITILVGIAIALSAFFIGCGIGKVIYNKVEHLKDLEEEDD